MSIRKYFKIHRHSRHSRNSHSVFSEFTQYQTWKARSKVVFMYLTGYQRRGNVSCIAHRVCLHTMPIVPVACHSAIFLSVIRSDQHEAIQYITSTDQSGCIFREIYIDPSIDCVNYKLPMICYWIHRRLTFDDTPKQTI